MTPNAFQAAWRAREPESSERFFPLRSQVENSLYRFTSAGRGMDFDDHPGDLHVAWSQETIEVAGYETFCLRIVFSRLERTLGFVAPGGPSHALVRLYLDPEAPSRRAILEHGGFKIQLKWRDEGIKSWYVQPKLKWLPLTESSFLEALAVVLGL